METRNGNPLDRIPATALSPAELVEFFAAHGQPAFRATQTWQSLYSQGACSWEEVRGLPRALWKQLQDDRPLLSSRLVDQAQAREGTTKLALELADGQVIESVVIPAQKRLTLCLSTQAGCPVGCIFCASGMSGLARNLAGHEILEQFIHARRHCGRIDHLVVMGIGEPLHNLDNLLPALAILQDDKGAGIGARRIVVSTIGIIPAMDRLRQRRPPLNLAVSLHTADPKIRRHLVPGVKEYGIGEILAAARRYQKTTGRQVTFETVLVDGLNDDLQAARKMAGLLRDGGFFVNLLPCNPVEGLSCRPPAPARVQAFADCLARAGIAVQVRRPMGLGEAAACGQLRRRASTGEP